MFFLKKLNDGIKKGTALLLIVMSLLLHCLTPIYAQKSAEPESSIVTNRDGDVSQMNGIHFVDYADFPQNWKQVTVRFRTDTGEQRFVYANDIAYEALSKGVTNYPDGAVFAKIGIMTEDDPDFISSRVPSSSKRIQFMVRNASLYAATSGWGYALFKPSGVRLSNEPVVKQSEACDACHQAVKNKGYVFSQPVDFSFPASVDENGNGALSSNALPTAGVTFSDVPLADLPPDLADRVPAGTVSVRGMDGPIRDHVFVGTLDEVRPTLIHEAIQSGHPATLMERGGENFVLVTADLKNDPPKNAQILPPHIPQIIPCPDKERGYLIYSRLPPATATPFLNMPRLGGTNPGIVRQFFCKG